MENLTLSKIRNYKAIVGAIYTMFSITFIAFLAVEFYYVHKNYDISPVVVVLTHIKEIDLTFLYIFFNALLSLGIGVPLLLGTNSLVSRKIPILRVIALLLLIMNSLPIMIVLYAHINGEHKPIIGVLVIFILCLSAYVGLDRLFKMLIKFHAD